MDLTSENVKVPRDEGPGAFLVSVTIFNHPYVEKEYFPLSNENFYWCTLCLFLLVLAYC